MADPAAMARLNTLLEGVDFTPPSPAGKEDWVYRDIPLVAKRYWHFLTKELLGEENYMFIAGTDRGDSVRGQLFISPQGMKNLSAFNALPDEERTARIPE